jgi:Domain of unknown function (DUF5666)
VGRIRLPQRRLLLSLLIACVAGIGRSAAQEPAIPALRGNITAVEPPDGFDVDGYHVITSAATQFLALNGKKKKRDELRGLIATGAYVQVIGDKDSQSRTVTARQVKVRDDSDRLSGVAVIDRIDSRDPLLLFRGDGYHFRLPADAQISFKGDITGAAGVGTGTWIRYEGNRDTSGELVITKAEFIKPKPRKPKGDPAKLAQVTDFPAGSRIDLDGSFQIKLKADKTDDTPGGVCGWYPVPDVPAAQEHVRRLGMKLVPQYQRDLPDDDPAKIHFRFYVVEERDLRSDLSCHEGLVLVPVTVINRLRNEDQLAAVLADGVAASLQLGQARIAMDWRTLWEEAGFAALSAAGGPWGLGYAGGMVGNTIVNHTMQRKLENQRGRVALSLMSDAGFDPWQAPEAWRLLAPEKPPKDPSKLKYPERAGYQLEFLRQQYKPAAASATVAPQTVSSSAKPQ